MTALPVRGICYDAGVRYAKDFHSRPHWRLDDVRRDLVAIRDQLSCNAVSVMATDTQRLIEAGEVAAELGLFVWLQPRLIESRARDIETAMRRLGALAEKLRARHDRVGINVGCELTLMSPGMVPGGSFGRRGQLLPHLLWLKPYFDRRLDRLLGRLASAARESFRGPLTYGAGDWETVDWSRFDAIGLDTYREAHNESVYADQVRQRVGYGKPVLVTEFGCCSYRGAAERGASGYDILDHRTDPPSIPDGIVRDEQVQADYLTESIDLLVSAGVHGAFVFAFSEPMLTPSPDPASDADVASFGIVKVTRAAGPEPDAAEQWTPKAGFHAVAARYRDLTPREGTPSLT